MRRHNNVHHGKQEFGCPDCGIFFNTDDAVQSHFNRKYKMEPVPSRGMCYQWKWGNFIDETLMVAVLVQNIPEEGSGS